MMLIIFKRVLYLFYYKYNYSKSVYILYLFSYKYNYSKSLFLLVTYLPVLHELLFRQRLLKFFSERLCVTPKQYSQVITVQSFTKMTHKIL